MRFRVLTTVITAVLAISFFIGGLSIYEVDQFIRVQTENLLNITCEKEAAQINEVFAGMEKSVRFMESYLQEMIDSKADIEDFDSRKRIIEYADRMFADVAKNTGEAVAYYLRFDPKLASDYQAGFFYSKIKGEDEYTFFEATDLSLYDKTDTEHVGWFWQPYVAKQPIWMKPYYNQNNEILMISYVIPMYCDNQFIGVVGMDFDYTVLTDKVQKIKIYENGFAQLEMDSVVLLDNAEGTRKRTTDMQLEYLQVSEKLMNGMTLVLFASREDTAQVRHNIESKIFFTAIFLGTLFSLSAIYVVRRIVKPLMALTEAAKVLATGNYDVEIVHGDTYEIKLLSTAFENMTHSLRENQKLQHLLAYRDSMTGLRNTTSYKAWISDFEKEIKKQRLDFGVVLLDLNNLKQTNDQYGHEVGNRLIVSASQIISEVFKRSPVFRVGGDELLVILQNKDLAEYKELFAKLDSECDKAFVETERGHVGISLARGFALYDCDRDMQFVDVFNRADEEMYKNKKKMKAERC